MGLALGGSHGIFTNPGKALGRIFSLKNVVPDVLTLAGSAIGGPIGAGLGYFAGEAIEGKSLGQAALGGLETFGLDEVGGSLLGKGGVSGAVGSAVGKGLSGTVAGDAVTGVENSQLGQDVSGLVGDVKTGIGDVGGALGLTNAAGSAVPATAGTGTIIGNDINSAASRLGLGGAGGSILGNAVNSAGSALGIGAPAATGAASAPAPASSGGIGGILGDLGITKANALPAAIAAGGLLYDTSRSQNIPGLTQLQSEANQFAAQGNQLQSYLQSGTLPTGVQSSIDEASQAAEAEIRSQYAAMGLSGSSMEAQALASVKENTAAQGASIAATLLSQGVNESQIASQLYGDLLTFNQQQNTATGSAISSLAEALAGGYSPRQSTG
jgi:hypothetical protein